MKKVLKFSIISVLILIFTSTFAQDVQFSQPTISNVYINPALVGIDSSGRIGITHKWSEALTNNITNVNGYQYISKLNAYAGINYTNHNLMNLIYSNSFSLFYGQNINIKGVLIRPAIEIGILNKMIDWNKFNNGISSGNQSNYSFYNVIDLNTGLFAYYKKFSLGLSAHHINTPNEGNIYNSPLPRRFGVQFAYQYDRDRISVSPFMIYKHQQYFSSLILGINTLICKHINVGISCLNSDVFIPTVGFKNNTFNISYSFDSSFSKLETNPNLRSQHELRTSLCFGKTIPHKKLLKVKSIFS